MKKIIFFTFLIIVLLSLIFYCYRNNNNFKVSKKIETNRLSVCPYSTKKVTVNGASMFPFLNSGQEVEALFNYYDCHDILRNDVVLYKYSGDSNLLIKFVRAVPGDRWDLKKTGDGYEITVNGTSLLNAEGQLYLISEGSVKMLELYVKDYPIIPENTYLLLGNKVNGSLDSTRFGLVGRNDIMARVEVSK